MPRRRYISSSTRPRRRLSPQVIEPFTGDQRSSPQGIGSIDTAVETVSALEERLEEAKSQLASAVSDRDTLVANAVAASAAERNVLREYESGLA